MKHFIIFILITTPFFVNAQQKESSSKIIEQNYYDQNELYTNSLSSKQFIYNIAASFQKFKEDNSKDVSIPIVVIDGKTYKNNDFEEFHFNQIESFKIQNGKGIRALFGSTASELIIIIELKKEK